MCCGTPWSSKGIPDGYEAMRATVLPAIRKATDNGRLPVVCDASSCTEGFRHMLETEPDLHVEVVDAVAFVARRVLPVLGEYRKIESVTIHPTCSSTQMGLNADLVAVAGAVAETVNGSGGRGLLRLRRGPRNAAPRTDRVRHPARGRRGRKARCSCPRQLQPHL